MLGRRTRGDRVRRDRWVWLSLLPFGLGSWAPILAGIRRRVWWWIVLGLLWEAVSVTGVVLSGVEQRGHNSAAGLLILVGWIGGAIASFSIRRSYDRRAGRPRRARLPWPTPTARSREWTVRYALVAYVATFVGANGLGLFMRYVLNLQIQVGLGVLLVDAFLLAALLPLRGRLGLSPQDLGLRFTRGPRSIGLVVLGLFAYGAVTALWAVTLEPHSTAKTLSGNPPNPSTLNIVLAVIAISASAPIVEEIFFRGLLYRSLRNRLPVLGAALIAGCLFGLVHITGYPLVTLPVKAAFGVIACLLYERTGSLLPGIALHAFVDAGIVDYALTGNDVVVLISSGAIAVLVTLTAVAGGVRRRLAPLPEEPPAVVADGGEVQAVGGGGWPGG